MLLNMTARYKVAIIVQLVDPAVSIFYKKFSDVLKYHQMLNERKAFRHF